MKRLIRKAVTGLKGSASKQVDKAKKTAGDPEARANFAKSAAGMLSAERLRGLADSTLGKERTDNVLRYGEGVYRYADKTCGEGRLKGAFDSGKTALLTVPVAGKALPIVLVGSAAAGFVTRKNVVEGVTDSLFGNGEKGTATPAAPDGKADAPQAAAPAQPKSGDKKPPKGAPKPPQA